MENDFPTKVVINAPRLGELRVYDVKYTSYSFVENPTTLVKAHIDLEDHGDCEQADKKDDNAMVLSLIRGISCVVGLYILDCGKTIRYLGSLKDEVVPVFNNLTRLEINAYQAHCDWKVLLLSLRCFPKLEVVEVTRYSREEENSDAFDALPTTLLTNLKRMELCSLYGFASDVKMLEYILNNASVMEQLVLMVNCDGMQKEERMCKECKFCETVFKLPRSSPTCEIKILGEYVTASSNDLHGKSLKWQLKLMFDE